MDLATFAQEKNLTHATVQKAIKAYEKWTKNEKESKEEKEYQNFVSEFNSMKEIAEFNLKQEAYTSLLNKYLKVQSIIEKNKELFDSFYVAPINPDFTATDYQKKYIAMWAYLFKHPWVPIFVEDDYSDYVRLTHFCKYEDFFENFDEMFFSAYGAEKARKFLLRYKKELEKN